jgi:ParB-like chromosome segregation protein Spo0J
MSETMNNGLQVHEAASIFPMMPDDDYAELVDDIRKHGLRDKIRLLDGKIIDGRNRYRACSDAGVEPQFESISTDDPAAYVVSVNLHRRQLTPSQRSMVAARVREFYDNAAKERMVAGKKIEPSGKSSGGSGDARDQAGKAVGVSGKMVDYATKVLKQAAPEIIAAVDTGKMAVKTAAIVASEPVETQREIAASTPNRIYKAGKNGVATVKEELQEPTPEQRAKSKAIFLANEAIDALKRIQKNDPLRKRGFQIVNDWIRANQ